MNCRRFPAGAGLALLAALTGCAPGHEAPTTGVVTYLEHIEEDAGWEWDCGYGYDGYGCDYEHWYEPACLLVEFEDAQGRWWEECAASEAVFDSLVVGAPYTEGQTVPYEPEPTF